MGTRSRAGRKKTGQGSTQSPAPSPAQQPEAQQAAPAQPQPQAQPQAQAPATMRKGVYLSALIYVEGDQAPADDFTAAAESALKQALPAQAPNGYTITVKKIDVQNDVADSGQDGADGTKSKAKSDFQF